METTRRAGLAVIAAAALWVWLGNAPAEEAAATGGAQRFERLIEVALDDFEANEERAESAPQQQVVNGWVARDLLTIIAYQQNALLSQPRDERPAALAGLAVLAICWWGALSPHRSPVMPPPLLVAERPGDDITTESA